MVCTGQPGNQALEFVPPTELSGWEFRWGDSPISSTGIPLWTVEASDEEWKSTDRLFGFEGDSEDYIWIRTRLPDELTDPMSVAARYIWMDAEIYIDSIRVYQSGLMEYEYGNRFNGYRLHLVNLPPGSQGKMLYVRISSGFGDVIGIVPHHLFVGQEKGLIRHAVRRDIMIFILGFIILDIGIVVLLLLLLSKRDKESKVLLFHISLFAVCYGINYICSHSIAFLWIQNAAALYFLTSLFFLFPVGLLGIFECFVGTGRYGIIQWLKYVHLSLWVLSIGSDILGFVPQFMWSPIIFSVLAISLVSMTITLIPAIKNNQGDTRLFGVGMIITIIPGFFDTIVHGILINTELPALSPWGILIFMFMLGLLLDRRFSSNSRQLRKAHGLLESYNATLEERVKDRTLELSSKNEKLKQTLSELKEAQTQLVQSEKMASLGQLTAGIAHEIKNPLNFVNNFATLSIEIADELGEAVKDRDDVKYLLDDLKLNASNIAKHGKRADHIVRSMMEHSRSGSGEVQSVSFNDLVDKYIDLAFHGMRAKEDAIQVQMQKKFDEQVVDVVVVPQEIGRVIINVCSNAFDAMREKMTETENVYQPILNITTAKKQDCVELRVKDNGIGISADVREKIFEPFFTTKSAGSGTGLGLSISYDIIVHGHNGQFEVSHTGADGTEFVFRLPVYPISH